MERQLTSPKNIQLGLLERILPAAGRAWQQNAPLYLRYGMRYFLGGAAWMYVETEEARFSIRPHSFDLYVIREVFEGHAYEPRLPLAPPRAIVDLGANIGAFSIWAGGRWSPDRIVAVEMEPENFALLRENLGANLGKEAVALQAAVWESDRGVRIRRHRLNKGRHEVLPEAGEMEVPSMTLAGILAAGQVERVDFLKVDIEGAEAKLFTPANAAIFATRVGFVSAELHPNKGVDVGRTVRYLQECGFEVQIRRQPTNRAVMMEAARIAIQLIGVK